jgi:acyl-CoA dehydrogenase
MDFNDTPEEAEFRTEARAFLEKHTEALAPGESAGGMSERGDPDAITRAQEWQATKKDNGWACLTWPKEYGGRGATPIQSVIWNQEEGKRRTAPNVFGIGIGMLGPTIMAHGTDEQKERFLPSMARGDEIWCQLFSEPNAGSDLAGLRMSAVQDGDEWVLNGQKIWTTGATYCKWGMVITRSDPTKAKHDGLTYFIIDMESPGIEIRPIRQINGASGFNEVFFSDARTPDSLRVGAVGDGWRGATTTLMNERASIGGGGGGSRPEDLLRLAKQVGRLDDASVRQRIADFYIRSSGLKYTGYRTLTAISRGTIPGPESSIGKLVGAPMSQELAAFGIDLQGPAGSLMEEEFACQDAYLGSPGIRIAGGTDEIMREIIARRVLRLPQDPRVDKNIPFSDIPTGS